MQVIALGNFPFVKKGKEYEIIAEYHTFFVIRGENGIQTTINKIDSYRDTDMLTPVSLEKAKITANDSYVENKKSGYNLKPRVLKMKIMEGITLNSYEKLAIISLIDEEDSLWNYKD